jgi:hypothetical protein
MDTSPAGKPTVEHDAPPAELAHKEPAWGEPSWGESPWDGPAWDSAARDFPSRERARRAADAAPRGPATSVDARGLLGVAFGPGAAAVLVAALAQSIGHWFGRDVVADAGGPATLLLGTSVVLYAVFALMHGLHALGDALLCEDTPLWWQPDRVSDGEDDAPLPRAPAFPCHLDGAVLSGGVALALWLTICALA